MEPLGNRAQERVDINGARGERARCEPQRFERHGVTDLAHCLVVVPGTIHDVGLRGAYFSTSEPPPPGTPALLRGPSGWLAVRVVWSQNTGNAGAGLAFET